MSRKTAIIVCPGRGTYNPPELGYLRRFHSDKAEFIALMDGIRAESGQISITEMDSAKRFSSSLHGRGDNVSLLIYTCAIADFLSINLDNYEIVGVAGNSMGWYLSHAVSGSLSLKYAGALVNTMGNIMTEHGKGGQIVYSLVDRDWKLEPSKYAVLQTLFQKAQSLDDVFISTSIHLGGLVVLAANEAGIKLALKMLPKNERFPFQIQKHSAFHSSLLDHCVPLAKETIMVDTFGVPDIPMIDGLGNVWNPFATDPSLLYEYTLGRQINETYDFSKSIQVSIKEFAPDVFIVLGPGATLGAPIAQTMIAMNWQDLSSKDAFKKKQDNNPVILSMGIDEQRKLIIEEPYDG